MHACGSLRIVALVRDVEWERHIRNVLVRPSIIRWIRSMAELEQGAGLASANLVLWHMEPSDDATVHLGPTLRHVRAVIPTSTIVLYCRLAPEVARVLLEAGRLGVDRVALRGYDDLNRIVGDALHAQRYAEAIEQILGRLDLTDSRVALEMAQVIRHAFDAPVSVKQLAAELGVDRRTLHNRLHAAGLPSAGALISWSRLFAVGWLLDHETQTVGSVGRSLGFTSASELRGMLARYVHVKPTELRRQGALNAILEAFRSARGRAAAMPLFPPNDGSFPSTD